MIRDPQIWYARRIAQREHEELHAEMQELRGCPEYEDVKRAHDQVADILRRLKEGSPAQQRKAADRAMELR